jgi:predicted glycoside hydrolase/deacetylase ChbG (UPF0249 family)
MLIINADDFGRNKLISDNTLEGYRLGRLTSASAMVFMHDSERAAELALGEGLDVGLHLNFTEAFDSETTSSRIVKSHQRIISFLKRGKYWQLIYNPLLKKEFEYSFNKQFEEYFRLYKKMPAHIDGHHHMHLCSNMVFSGIIPSGLTIRKCHSFKKGEKFFLNRLFRLFVDSWILQHYRCVDYFYSIQPISDTRRLKHIIHLAQTSNVELMMHPERSEEMKYIMNENFMEIISTVKLGTYKEI